MSVYDQLMARFKRPNKTSLTRQEAVAPTPGQAASNLSAPPLSNGAAPAATIPASSVRAGRRAVDVNKAKDPDRVKENMVLINGGASNTTDETTAGAGSVKPTSHSVEVHDAQAPKYDSYDRMLEFLQANQVADADADARARRREMFASIGDGISAISSLYQTTKGAPVTYTPGADMSKVMRDRYDRMIAQRKANSGKYLNYLKVQAAKEAAEKSDLYQERKLKNEERRLDNYERETARREKRNELLERVQDWKEQYEQGLLDDKAERRRIDEAYKNKLISLREKDLLIKELNATTAKRRVDISEQPTTTERTVTKDDGYGGVETVTTSQTTYKGGSSSRGSRSSGSRSGSKQKGGLKPNRLGL